MGEKQPNSSDPTRRLMLLWSSQNTVSRSGLSIKGIIAVAIEIADAEGLEAVSMRNVAEKLKVGTMSLYTYVPGKTELVDLMLDTAYGELYESVDTPSQQTGGWQEALRFIAFKNWELYRQHPWILQIANGRPAFGPHLTFKYEAELRPLDNLGLSDIEMDATLTLVLTHVEGCARTQAAMERNQRDSGQTDAEWWVTQAPVMSRLIDPRRFPTATRVGAAAGEAYQAIVNPTHVLNFGLDRILAGVAALIDSKTAPTQADQQ